MQELFADPEKMQWFVYQPLVIILIAGIAQYFVKNTLIVTGAIFTLLVIVTFVFFYKEMLIYAVLYYLCSYLGTFVCNLLMRNKK